MSRPERGGSTAPDREGAAGGGDVVWRLLGWQELARDEVHDLFRLRQRIFVVEQACAYEDIDGLDPVADHLIGRAGGELVAYARILPARGQDEGASIGRVVVRMDRRGLGLGREAMERAIRICDQRGGGPIRVAAQHHLQDFYRSLGFSRTVREPYVWDGILHVDLVRDPPTGPDPARP